MATQGDHTDCIELLLTSGAHIDDVSIVRVPNIRLRYRLGLQRNTNNWGLCFMDVGQPCASVVSVSQSVSLWWWCLVEPHGVDVTVAGSMVEPHGVDVTQYDTTFSIIIARHYRLCSEGANLCHGL